MGDYVGDAAAGLQRLLSERRFLAGRSLSMDGYDRWGHGSDPGFEAEIARLGDIGGRKRALSQAFARGVAALRAADPAAVMALARAHQALLAGCIETSGDDSTAAFVARQEQAGWRRIEVGEADDLDQNCFYIHYDPARFAALFGFPLGWPIPDRA